MTAGRPSEYSEEILKKANEYLLSCEDEEVERGTDERPIYSIRVKLPTIGGLARYLGVARSTLYEWEKATLEDNKTLKYPEFSDIIEQLRAEQEEKLINNGLSGDYNPTITKVLLTKHGYADKVEQDVTSGGEKISVAVVKYSEPIGEIGEQGGPQNASTAAAQV